MALTDEDIARFDQEQSALKPLTDEDIAAYDSGLNAPSPEQGLFGKIESFAKDLNRHIFPSEYDANGKKVDAPFIQQGVDLLNVPKRMLAEGTGTGDMTDPNAGLFNHFSESFAEENQPKIAELEKKSNEAQSVEEKAKYWSEAEQLKKKIEGFKLFTDLASDPTITGSLGMNAIKGALKKFLGKISGEGAMTAEKAAANAQATRSNIPLTKEQQAASIDSQLPEGTPGMVEKTLSTVPGSRGIYEAHKLKVRDAVKEEISKIKGTDLSQEEIANQVTESLATRMENLTSAFSEDYQNIIKHGNASIEGLSGKNISEGVKKAANDKAPIFGFGGKNIPTGLSEETEKTIRNLSDQMGNIESVPAEQRYQIFRNEKTKLGKELSKASGPDKAVLGDVYNSLKNSEEDFIANLSGVAPKDQDKLLKTLQDVNDFFAATKPIREFEKKAIGFNKDIGEKGAVNAQEAMKNLLKPNKTVELQAIMKLNPEELNESIRAGLMTKIFDNARIENGTFVSLSKLQREVDKYGMGNIKTIVGEEKANRLKDLMVGMQRARTDKLKFADPTNPSGTGQKIINSVLYGGSIGSAIAGFLNPVFWKATAIAIPSFYANRVIAKVLTGTEFNAAEKAVGTVLSKTSRAANKIAPYSAGGSILSEND